MAARTGGRLHLRARELPLGLTLALCEAVRVWAEGILPGSDGVALRDHIEQICRQTGKSPEELGFAAEAAEDEGPDVPEEGAHLWAWFHELCGGRGNNGFGPAAISWSDMEAWARLTATPLTPYDVLTLRSMDAAFLSLYAAETEKRAKTKGK